MTLKNSISVIIRTSNTERPLRRLLSRLKRESADEIIVVDTGSKDRTIDVAEKAGAMVMRNEKTFNYSKTLNLGFAASKNSWLLALSSHGLPVHDDLLTHYRAALAQLTKAPAVIYGLQYWSRPQYARVNKDLKIYSGISPENQVQGGGNSNALYSREAWLAHPFNEDLSTAEDLEWRMWAADAGLISVTAPQAAIYYLHPGGPTYRFRKAWGEVRILNSMGLNSSPMTPLGLGLGVAQATRRLLWEAGAVRPWIGQMAHQLGAFCASQKQRSRNRL
jgi:rhamnosyltransferase